MQTLNRENYTPNKTTLFTNEKKDFFYCRVQSLFDHKFLVFHSFESYISVVGQGPGAMAPDPWPRRLRGEAPKSFRCQGPEAGP